MRRVSLVAATLRAITIAIAGAIAFAACSLPDPVHDRAVERLGPEGAGGAGPNHRAGQSCGTCHGASGPATTDFSVAGTVFATPAPGSLAPVAGAEIDLVDAVGTSPPATSPVMTNCAGNFFVARTIWDPTFPVRVSVRQGAAKKDMQSDIGRAASCADCHALPPADPLAKAGPVFLFETAAAAGAGALGRCP